MGAAAANATEAAANSWERGQAPSGTHDGGKGGGKGYDRDGGKGYDGGKGGGKGYDRDGGKGYDGGKGGDRFGGGGKGFDAGRGGDRPSGDRFGGERPAG